MRYSNRMQSDPGFARYSNATNGNSPYPTQQHQQSRDTVNTNGSNGSHSEPYSNEHSSDNSSVERAAPVRQPDLGEQYGFQGFGGGPIMEEHGQNNPNNPNNSYFVQQPNNYPTPPQAPVKTGPPPPALTQPIKLTKTNGSTVSPPANTGAQSRPNTEKRKSWLRRRFSKD
jgi:hypothetical protein